MPRNIANKQRILKPTVGAKPQISCSQDAFDERNLVVENPKKGLPHVKKTPFKALRDGPFTLHLASVANGCVKAGLDPAVEIPRLLAERKPLLDKDGEPVYDTQTGEMITVPLLDPDTLLRTHLSLLEYLQPKLRATEVKVTGNVELSAEQVEDRIKSLLGKVTPKGR